jgi:hypothetical protein
VGALVFSMTPVRLPGAGQLGVQVRGGTLGSVGVAIDPGNRRGAFLMATDGHPIALFDPATAFVRRKTRSAADKRLWSRLELQRLPDISKPTFEQMTQGMKPGEVVVLDPVFLTELAAGVLTGSVKQVGVDTDGNRRLTFNTSISKAERKRHVKEDERKSRKKQLTSIAVTDDIHGGEAVLRKDGSLAGIKIVFAVRPDKQTRLDLEARLTLGPVAPGAPRPDMTLPGKDTTVRVPALGTLKGTLTDQLMPAGGAAVPTGVPGVSVGAAK